MINKGVLICALFYFIVLGTGFINSQPQDSWLGINSSNLDSFCGDISSRTLSGALNGIDDWGHFVTETHWFILDLKESYNIKSVRGRSNYIHDPTVVNVYVSDNKTNFGAPVASNISTWKNTASWIGVDTIDKQGRYVKVEIVNTEAKGFLIWGNPTSPFSIFDVYGSIPEETEPPIISLISPEDNYQKTDTNITNFVYNISDESPIDNCSLVINGVVSQVDYSITKNVNQSFTRELGNGYYNWGVSCADSIGNIGNSGIYALIMNITIFSNTPPSITLNTPNNEEFLTTKPVMFNCTGTDIDSNLKEITLYGDWSSLGWQPEETKLVSGSSAEAIFYVNLSYGVFNWACLVRDSSYAETLSENRSFSINNLESGGKLVYNLSSIFPSGIEINNSYWQESSGEDDFSVKNLGRINGEFYDGAFVFKLDNAEKYDYFTSARLVFTSEGSNINSSVRLIISGAYVDNLEEFSESYRPSNVPRTKNQIEWIINNELAESVKRGTKMVWYVDYPSPNIAPIINEIISRPNWNKTNGQIALFVDDNSSISESNDVKIIFNYQKTEFYSNFTHSVNKMNLELSETAKDAVQNYDLVTAITGSSTLISMIFTDDIDFYVEYGTSPGVYSQNSSVINNVPAFESSRIWLTGLSPNTRYYYRVRVRDNRTNSNFEAFNEKSFVTSRNKGSAFKFSQITDTHIALIYIKDVIIQDYVKATLNNLVSYNPDFIVDTGDTFITDALHSENDTKKSTEFRYELVRKFLEETGLPYFFNGNGNHEAELGFPVGSLVDSVLTNWSIKTRNKFVPTFTPNTTKYGGNADHENYFAYDWGDATFVFIDPNYYTNVTPMSAEDWKIGGEQMQWLNDTLRTSDKKWKFVMSHHIAGGCPNFASDYYYGDGGGHCLDYGGDAKEINTLMEVYNAQFYLYGHVHMFAHDTNNWSATGREGSVNYVLAPNGGREEPYYAPIWAFYDQPKISTRGHINYEVSPYNVTFWLINQTDGQVLYNFTLYNNAPSVNLISPIDDSTVSEGNIDFTFNYDDLDYDWAKNCTLYINNIDSGSVPNFVKKGENATITKAMVNGTYSWYVSCSDGALFSNSPVYELTVGDILLDIEPPVVNLISPKNNYVKIDTNITNFVYNVSDESPIDNCSLTINGMISRIFTKELSNGKHNWSVSCADSFGNVGGSDVYTFIMNHSLPSQPQDSWLGINSSNLDSFCGDMSSRTLAGALNGIDDWGHYLVETHWFILDLKEIYNIKEIRGRSNYLHDPTLVNVYVSNNKTNFGTPVASNISVWKNTASWIEVDTIDKQGRYVKVEVTDTEINKLLIWGNPSSPFSIFDVYGIKN